MSEHILVGKDSQDVPVFTNQSPNSHQLVTGVSGSGKSSYLLLRERDFAKAGAAVITVNCSGAHDVDKKGFLPQGYEELYRCHDVLKDGIPLTMWAQSSFSPDFAVRGLLSAFDTDLHLGCRQKSLLYHELLEAYEKRPLVGDEMSSLLAALGDTPELTDVFAKIEYTYGFLRVSQRNGIFKPGRITELKIDTDYCTYKSVVNFTLALLFFQKKSILPDTELVLVLDEFQNQDLVHQDAPIPRLLKEGRKHGISLLLATQSLSGFSRQEKACINQAATRVYHRQTLDDAREIARCLSGSDSEQREVAQALSSLRIGQAMAVGSFVDANKRKHDRFVFISNYAAPKVSLGQPSTSRKPIIVSKKTPATNTDVAPNKATSSVTNSDPSSPPTHNQQPGGNSL